jgi:hypothetical protein
VWLMMLPGTGTSRCSLPAGRRSVSNPVVRMGVTVKACPVNG